MATRIPLRIVDPATLRRVHSEGRTFYEYERRAPRGLEKPVEDMTLAELIATQDSEPLSESRRSWLTTGQGVLSLDAPASPEHIQALIDFVADNGPRCLVDAIIENDEPTDRDEVDDRRYTPYTTIDPTTQRQILWEQERAQDGPLYNMRLASNEAGRLTVTNIGRGILPGRLSFTEIATSALRSFFASVGRAETLDDLHARVALTREILDDPIATKHFSPNATEERERYFESDDRLTHNSYEELNDDGDLIEHHRSTRRSPWELWHNSIPRNSSDPLELGMDLCSNAELESLLGATEWDEAGNLLDSERQALLYAS